MRQLLRKRYHLVTPSTRPSLVSVGVHAGDYSLLGAVHSKHPSRRCTFSCGLDALPPLSTALCLQLFLEDLPSITFARSG